MTRYFAFNADVQGGKPIGYGQTEDASIKMADMLCTMIDKMVAKEVVDGDFAPRFTGVERIHSAPSSNPEFESEQLAELMELEHRITNEYRFKAKSVRGL